MEESSIYSNSTENTWEQKANEIRTFITYTIPVAQRPMITDCSKSYLSLRAFINKFHGLIKDVPFDALPSLVPEGSETQLLSLFIGTYNEKAITPLMEAGATVNDKVSYSSSEKITPLYYLFDNLINIQQKRLFPTDNFFDFLVDKCGANFKKIKIDSTGGWSPATFSSPSLFFSWQRAFLDALEDGEYQDLERRKEFLYSIAYLYSKNALDKKEMLTLSNSTQLTDKEKQYFSHCLDEFNVEPNSESDNEEEQEESSEEEIKKSYRQFPL